MKEALGETVLELSKEDMKSNPKNPLVRMYDDGDLIGKFSLKTWKLSKILTWLIMISVLLNERLGVIKQTGLRLGETM